MSRFVPAHHKLSEILYLVAYKVFELTRAAQRLHKAKVTYRTVVDQDIRWRYLVVEGLRELERKLWVVFSVEDLEVAALVPEEAFSTPTAQGVSTSIEDYLPLVHAVLPSLLTPNLSATMVTRWEG